MKKIGLFVLGLVIILTLAGIIACGNNKTTDETEAQMKTKVEAAMNTTNLGVNVAENLTLPTAKGDVAISWSSDKADVVSNTGVVTRPTFGQADQEVKLTASFSYKDYSDTKTYTLSVKSIKEKVFTFANGHSGENAIFTAPENGSFGSVEDKGEGVVRLIPSASEGTNAPYFKISDKISTWRGNGFCAEVQIYVDHEELKEEGKSFNVDFGLNKEENAALGSIYLTFGGDEDNALIYHNQAEDAEEDFFVAASGWYNIGVRYHEKNGKLAATVYINDIMGTELHKWELTKFRGFNLTGSTGEHEDVAIDTVKAPRYLSFSGVNVSGIDVKKVTICYND